MYQLYKINPEWQDCTPSNYCVFSILSTKYNLLTSEARYRALESLLNVMFHEITGSYGPHGSHILNSKTLLICIVKIAQVKFTPISLLCPLAYTPPLLIRTPCSAGCHFIKPLFARDNLFITITLLFRA